VLGKRNDLQHGDRSRAAPGARGDSRSKIYCSIGIPNAAALEKLSIRRLPPVAEGPHRPLPLKGLWPGSDGSTGMGAMGSGIIDWWELPRRLREDGFASPPALKRTGTLRGRRKNPRGKAGLELQKELHAAGIC